MRVIAVGRPGRLLAESIAEYETRAARYWSFDVAEVREERAHKGMSDDAIRDAEGERILQRVPAGAEVIALTRTGEQWLSTRLSQYLQQLGAQGSAGVAFVIGGAIGLGADVLKRATRQLRLSDLTLTHELARLVLAEQLYRAGTIARGEPYHKGAE
ncbi:MAG: 23S rRNA (pseudouridine(1915)-N(3))-methyltransferase RlmH [Longimicrobiales bacterium]